MGGDGEPVMSDKFEQHAGKIISTLIVASVVAGATAVVHLDKRMALLEAAVERDSKTIWTRSQQETYDARISARLDTLDARLRAVESR